MSRRFLYIHLMQEVNRLLFTPFSVTRFAMHRIYANRINSRHMSRIFCDLRSQKTPRGILPVNSNVNSYCSPPASVDCCQLVDPFVAFEAQEYRQTFKDLIGLHSDHHKFYRQLPVECGQKGQWHYNAPDGNQVHIHRKFGIPATLDDTDSDRHLIRHSNHDHTHNNHEVVCIQSGLRGQSVHG